MKTLKAGTTKYLLIDEKTVLANQARTRKVAPVAVVVEHTEAGPVIHTAHTVEVRGAVSLRYEQHSVLPIAYRIQANAAWVTDGEVVLDPAPTFDDQPTPAAEPTNKPTRKSQKA